MSYHGSDTAVPLMNLLARNPDWAIVYVGAGDIIFIRKEGPAGKLAQPALTAENFDVADYVRRIEAIDAAPGRALVNAASLLQTIGWTKQANAVMIRAIESGPRPCGITPYSSQKVAV